MIPTPAQVKAKQKADSPIFSHFWKDGSRFALCGAGPRYWDRKKYPNGHPKSHLYPRCQDCLFKAQQMGLVDEKGALKK